MLSMFGTGFIGLALGLATAFAIFNASVISAVGISKESITIAVGIMGVAIALIGHMRGWDAKRSRRRYSRSR